MRRYQKDDFPALTSDRLAILQRATTKEEVHYGGLGESGRVIPWRNRGGNLTLGGISSVAICRGGQIAYFQEFGR